MLALKTDQVSLSQAKREHPAIPAIRAVPTVQGQSQSFAAGALVLFSDCLLIAIFRESQQKFHQFRMRFGHGLNGKLTGDQLSPGIGHA